MTTPSKRRVLTATRGPRATKLPKWKQLEEDVTNLMRGRAEKEPMIYHRFYDTAAAGAFLPAQPGDHLVIRKGVPIVIETKFSSRYVSLVSIFSKVPTDQQLAFARLWSRALAYYLIVFQGTAGYELWDGEFLYYQRINKQRINRLQVLGLSDDLEDLLSGVKDPRHIGAENPTVIL